MLLEEAEQVIHSVLEQLASVELLLLLQPEAHLAQLDPAAMLFIEISSIANENEFFVQYSLPNIDDSFKLLQIKTIPFPTKNSVVFFELNLDYSLIAINAKNLMFEFIPGLCAKKSNIFLCQSKFFWIHNNAVNCAEELILKESILGPLCRQDIKLTMTQEQKYLTHHEEDSIMLFSPFTDALEIQCDTPNIRSNIHSLDIEIGLNKVFLPNTCVQ